MTDCPVWNAVALSCVGQRCSQPNRLLLRCGWRSLFARLTQSSNPKRIAQWRCCPNNCLYASCGHELGVFAPTIEVITTKLGALVGMNHHPGFGSSVSCRHHHFIEYYIDPNCGAHWPINDCPRVKINGHTQAQPAFMRAYIGDIRDPNLVGLLQSLTCLLYSRRSSCGVRWPV